MLGQWWRWLVSASGEERGLAKPVRPARAGAAIFAVLVFALAACGGDDGSDADGTDAGGNGDASTDGGAASDGGDLDVCALLDDDEIASVLGQALPSEPGDDDSPFPSCSWDTGRVIVQVAPGDELVLAPGQECPSLDLGDDAVSCPGAVQFLVDGSRVLVSTISNVTEDQLVEIGRILEPKVRAIAQ